MPNRPGRPSELIQVVLPVAVVKDAVVGAVELGVARLRLRTREPKRVAPSKPTDMRSDTRRKVL